MNDWEEKLLKYIGREYHHKFGGYIIAEKVDAEKFDVSDVDSLTGIAHEMMKSEWWESIPKRDEPKDVSGEINS